jgi:uncharacterized protein (TIGR03032 family)
VTTSRTVQADLLLDPACIDRVVQETIADRSFIELIQQANISLVAALRPGAIACFGARDGALTVSCTPVPRPLGLATDGTRLAIGTYREIVVCAPSSRLAPHVPNRPNHHDVVYVPVSSFRTGECMVHDMALDGPSVVFANTQFSCLARADGLSSFRALWQPKFITQLLPQDRCHLNSFATDGRRIRYATAFAACDTPTGYRAMPLDSGVIIDVEANAVVASGLIRPHSVRLINNELYVLNSAAGEVMRVDIEGRRSTTLASLPGFTRGLRAHGEVLFVGLSTLRATAQSLNLPLSGRRDTLIAGIAALDRATGRVLGMLRLASGVEELFDFVLLPNVRQALVMPQEVDATHIGIETEFGSFWMAAAGDLRPATHAAWPDTIQATLAG